MVQQEVVTRIASSVGGEKSSVVMYTTTLRGIRKTFEEYSAVKSIIQGYQVHLIERDISMDASFKYELTNLMLMLNLNVKVVPVVFVKGKYIGGAEEVLRLHEEGKMEGYFMEFPSHPHLHSHAKPAAESGDAKN